MQQNVEAGLAGKPADLDALKALKLGDSTIDESVIDRMGVSGEKMELSVFSSITAPTVFAYVHPGNKLAAIVGFNKAGVSEDIAKDIAMQIAAMNPVAIDESGVTEDIKERELKIAREKAQAEGKPENLLDRIAEGALKKFYKDYTLLQQDYVKNPKQSIAQYLTSADKDLKVVAFKRFTLNAE